jgi:crossover junction endodeoxyribonuclease RuvC
LKRKEPENKYPLLFKSEKLPYSDKLYIGIDQSLTCTSVAFFKEQKIEVYQIRTGTNGIARLHLIQGQFRQLLEGEKPGGVAIEGYAFGANGRVFGLGELGGLLRLETYQKGYRMIEVPPTTLKKHLTGQGNVQKQVMIKELFKKYDIDTNDDNDCDAIALAIYAREFYETQMHFIATYREEIHKKATMIVGDHPNVLDHTQYGREMPDNLTVAQFEKLRRAKRSKSN